MNACRASLTAVLALAGAFLSPFAYSASHGQADDTDRVIIQWRDEVASGTVPAANVDEVHHLVARTGRQLALARHIGGRFELLRLDHPHTPAELQALLAQLRKDPAIALAEPDGRVHALSYLPSDPLFTSQWYLKSVEAAGIRADAAWDITHGNSSVVVAVLDTGVRRDHPDLTNKLLQGFDFVSGETATQFATANDGDGWDPDPSDPGDFISAGDLASGPFAGKGCGANGDNTTPTDSSWHGTRTSGMIAADTDNAIGIAGSAFNVRVLPVRVLGKCGGFDSDVLAGMYWAAGMTIPPALLSSPGALIANANPVQIINMSLGGTGACSASYAAAVSDITAHGVLIVVSAGNDGAAIASPANCPGAMAVVGVRHIGTKVGYSDLGPEAALAAPAGNCVNINPGSACLFSLDTTSNTGLTSPGGTTYTDQFNSNVGTSFSAPLAAGTAALMRSVNPSLTPAQLTARMMATARAFPTVFAGTAPPMCLNPTATGALAANSAECQCTTALCGAGLLDAGAAVTDALRPAAIARVVGTVGLNHTLTLDGSLSGVATGRSVASYAWTVVSTIGGASTPAISGASLAQATVLSPDVGTYTIQFKITDDHGASDTAQVSITGIGTGGSSASSSPPPAAVSSSSGGGSISLPSLMLLVCMLLVLTRRKLTRI